MFINKVEKECFTYGASNYFVSSRDLFRFIWIFVTLDYSIDISIFRKS